MLEAALAENRKDATAHYLLGTLLFSQGIFDEGMKQWGDAKALGANIPVIDADLGKAWLLIEHDTQRAVQAFADGSTSDPSNADIYIGLDQAMSLTLSPAVERAAMLSRYPGADSSESKMPVGPCVSTGGDAGRSRPVSLQRSRSSNTASSPGKKEELPPIRCCFEIELMQANADAVSGNCMTAEAFLMKKLPHRKQPTRHGPFQDGRDRRALRQSRAGAVTPAKGRHIQPKSREPSLDDPGRERLSARAILRN